MSEPIEQNPNDPKAGRSMVFRKRRFTKAQSPDQSRRQAALLESAWRHFREAAPMIAFLNTPHEALDGPPIHLAMESDDGLESVQRLLQDLTRKA